MTFSYPLLFIFFFTTILPIPPTAAASSTLGSSRLGIKAGGISLRNGYASSAIIYPNRTLELITIQCGDTDYNRSMLALTTSLEDDSKRTNMSLFGKLNGYVKNLQTLIFTYRHLIATDFGCDADCISIGFMITQVSKPLLDQLGCDHPFEISVPRLPSQRFQDILRYQMERVGCNNTQQRFYSDWSIELEAANLFDDKIMCEDCEEEQRRLYLMLTHDRTATLITLLFWEPPIGEVWRYHIIKRPEGELGRREWNAVQHGLNTTSTLTTENVKHGRVWGRNDLEVGTRPVDRVFLAGELVQQIELKGILQSLLRKDVVDRAYRELQGRNSSWALWSGAAGAASAHQRLTENWDSEHLHSEL